VAAIALPLAAGGTTVSPTTASVVSVNELGNLMMHHLLRGAKPQVRPPVIGREKTASGSSAAQMHRSAWGRSETW
jgi:hypothetical protein